MVVISLMWLLLSVGFATRVCSLECLDVVTLRAHQWRKKRENVYRVGIPKVSSWWSVCFCTASGTSIVYWIGGRGQIFFFEVIMPASILSLAQQMLLSGSPTAMKLKLLILKTFQECKTDWSRSWCGSWVQSWGRSWGRSSCWFGHWPVMKSFMRSVMRSVMGWFLAGYDMSRSVCLELPGLITNQWSLLGLVNMMMIEGGHAYQGPCDSSKAKGSTGQGEIQ